MFRSVAARALWLAKGAALFWGAVFTLALVVGVGSMALAAVPGDPFELGETNTINNALTKLAGSRDGGAMLAVDNNSSASGARALDLRVEAGKAPINVNADAGRAANLNADEVDGLGADQIGVNGLEQVVEDSAFDSVSNKNPSAECPEGKVLVGTAYSLFGGTDGNNPDQLTDVVVNSVVPTKTADGRDRVTAVAREEEPTTDFWSVTVYAFCVTEGTP